MKGFPTRTMHPILQILVALGLAIGGLSLATVLAIVLVSQLYGYSLQTVLQVSTNPGNYPHGWAALMLLQGASLAGAGAGAALMPAIVGVPWRAYFAPRRLGSAGWLLGAAALVIVIMPFMSMLIAWNAQAHFPAFAHDFELWARGKEDQAADLTKYLTDLSTSARLLVGFIVIALVPAMAEELVFRGVIQKNLVRWFRSRHVGVWLAAALFSAIHMQFFGFVPRFVLGLVLGYLYEWSGNILVPMAAHFTQNGLQLLLLFLAQHGYFGEDFNPDSNEALPWPTVLLSGLLTAGLLYFLRQRLDAPPAAITLSHDGVTVQEQSDQA
jgi:membrane protease YdiL (CAAX protease family)